MSRVKRNRSRSKRKTRRVSRRVSRRSTRKVRRTRRTRRTRRIRGGSRLRLAPPPPSTYDGEYNKVGNKHGQGKITYANGRTYEGGFVDGFRHGQGKETYASGTYEGGFVEGFRHGQGKETFTDGRSAQVGTWENGEFLRDAFTDAVDWTAAWARPGARLR